MFMIAHHWSCPEQDDYTFLYFVKSSHLRLGLHFPLPRSFQRIRPSPTHCVTFRNRLVFAVKSF